EGGEGSISPGRRERGSMASGSPDAPAGRKTKGWMQLFVPLLRPFRKQLCWAALAMVLDAFLTVFRPWPLKVVIDRVLSHKPSRVPFLHAWLDSAPFSRMEILYGACAATLLIAVLTGVLTYYFTRTMGAVGQHFVFTIRRDLFAHLQRRDRDEWKEHTSELQSPCNLVCRL